MRIIMQIEPAVVAVHKGGAEISDAEMLSVVTIARREGLDEVFRVGDYWQGYSILSRGPYNFRVDVR